MRWIVAHEYALENPSPAVVVDAESTEDAAAAAWAIFEQEATGESVCRECDSGYGIDLLVVPFDSFQLVTPGPRYFVLKPEGER